MKTGPSGGSSFLSCHSSPSLLAQPLLSPEGRSGKRKKRKKEQSDLLVVSDKDQEGEVLEESKGDEAHANQDPDDQGADLLGGRNGLDGDSLMLIMMLW